MPFEHLRQGIHRSIEQFVEFLNALTVFGPRSAGKKTPGGLTGR